MVLAERNSTSPKLRRRFLMGLAAVATFGRQSTALAQEARTCRYSKTIGAWRNYVHVYRADTFSGQIELRNNELFLVLGADRSSIGRLRILIGNIGSKEVLAIPNAQRRGKQIVGILVFDGEQQIQLFVEHSSDETVFPKSVNASGRISGVVHSEEDRHRFFRYFESAERMRVFVGLWDNSSRQFVKTLRDDTYRLANTTAALADFMVAGGSLMNELDAGSCQPLKGGCFFTTATCDYLGLSDDCFELTALRRFRDGWLSRSPAGRRMTAHYYRNAPRILERLAAIEDAEAFWSGIYLRYLLPCALLAALGMNASCLKRYRQLYRQLDRRAGRKRRPLSGKGLQME